MEHYISKSALVAEVKRRISLFKKEKKTEKWSAEASQMNVVSLGARIAMLEEVLSFINTLEVKEVEKEPKCMFTKDSYTDEDRKVLCEDCEEKCEYSKKEEPVNEDLL